MIWYCIAWHTHNLQFHECKEENTKETLLCQAASPIMPVIINDQCIYKTYECPKNLKMIN